MWGKLSKGVDAKLANILFCLVYFIIFADRRDVSPVALRQREKCPD